MTKALNRIFGRSALIVDAENHDIIVRAWCPGLLRIPDPYEWRIIPYLAASKTVQRFTSWYLARKAGQS